MADSDVNEDIKMIVLSAMTFVSISLPFSPFASALFGVIAAIVLIRLAVRVIEALPG